MIPAPSLVAPKEASVRRALQHREAAAFCEPWIRSLDLQERWYEQALVDPIVGHKQVRDRVGLAHWEDVKSTAAELRDDQRVQLDPNIATVMYPAGELRRQLATIRTAQAELEALVGGGRETTSP